MRLKRFLCGIYWCFFVLCSGWCFGDNSITHHLPTEISFHDNEKINVTLSDHDINRVLVSHDEVTELTYPADYCKDHRESDGSVELTLATQVPFTMYFATKQGHHFSLRVLPKNKLGETVSLVAQDPSVERIAGLALGTSYPEQLIDFMKKMMRKKIPAVASTASNIPVGKSLTLTLVHVVHGTRFQGEVYQLQNKSKIPMTLKPSDFYHDGIRAVAISESTLAPLATAILYAVTMTGKSA